MVETFLAIAMIATFGLVAGGIFLIARRRDRLRGTLMLVMAAVLIGNVVILTWPVPG